jgi:hypothetical protein
VVSDKKIFKISANENTLWTLAARGALAGLVVACVLDDIHIYDLFLVHLAIGHVSFCHG